MKNSLFLCLSLAALIVGSLVSCVQAVPVPVNQFNNEELRQVDENEFNKLYLEIKLHIEEANSLIISLYYFNWGKLGSIGWIPGMPGLQVPEEGTYFWVNNQVVAFRRLSSELSSKEDVIPLVVEAPKCLHLASSLWSNSPYKETQIFNGGMKQSTFDQWRNRCIKLSGQLIKTKTQIVEFETRTDNNYFANMENTLTEQDWVKENYLPTFEKKSIRYMELIDSTKEELEAACIDMPKLTEWRFISLSVTSDE